MSAVGTTLGGCVQKHPAAQTDEDLELPPLANGCEKPQGGDMTIKPPEGYVLVVNNLPDENA